MVKATPDAAPHRGEPEPLRPNPLRSLWLRFTGAAGFVTSALLTVATVTLLISEPRLFTFAELVPPDESLVTAYLPGAIALGVAVVLVARLRRIPSAVQLEADGVSIFSSRSDAPRRIGWGAVSAVASGSRWEGREVRVASGKGWFVSAELADAIESRWRMAASSTPDR